MTRSRAAARDAGAWMERVVGVVVHKKHGSRNPADQHVTMTLESFAVLLMGGQR